MSAAGGYDLCPHGRWHQPEGCPLPPPGPPVWAVSAGRSHPDLGGGSCWHRAHPPGWDRQWSADAELQAWLALAPGPSSHLGAPPDPWGARWEGRIRASQCTQSPLRRQRDVKCGGMGAGPGVLSPGFQSGFCCVTLGKSLSLSGCLCYKWTRLFQRSVKTVIPCTCPRMGDYPPWGPPLPSLASWAPWDPRWAEGLGAGSVCCPSWTLKLSHRSANALATAST